MAPRRLAILGSTGSVGTQALEVAARHPDRLRVVGLAAGSNVDGLHEQVVRWKPAIVALASAGAARQLAARLGGDGPVVVHGETGLLEVALHDEADMVLNAVVGAAGLTATWAAVRAGRPVALANKESLVMAGELIMAAARGGDVPVLPVDSEPNALHQCLRGTRITEVRRLILTASGGPFLGRPPYELAAITPEEALDHPTWKMGRRITIDSATLMNKGFELIESRWLFDLPPERIDVVIHPQSVVHSLVEFRDGSLLAQAGPTDMRLAIQDTLSWPDRWEPTADLLDLPASAPWTFLPASDDDYPALALARAALALGGTAPASLNAADEVAVEAFLGRRLPFDRIVPLVGEVLEEVGARPADSIEAVREADARARECARGRLAATG